MSAFETGTRLSLPIVLVSCVATVASGQHADAVSAWRSWNEKQAASVGRSMRSNGRVGGLFDTRIVSTHRSYNYKLRATWLTPEVIRAAARIAQLEQALTDDEASALVAEADEIGDTVVMVEIDPREGSGVIPRDWIALLQPKSDEGEVPRARGTLRPEARRMLALAGTHERDYAYDVFWLTFSLLDESGAPLFPDALDEAELVVRISGKEGRVSWKIPSSIRQKTRQIASSREDQVHD